MDFGDGEHGSAQIVEMRETGVDGRLGFISFWNVSAGHNILGPCFVAHSFDNEVVQLFWREASFGNSNYCLIFAIIIDEKI